MERPIDKSNKKNIYCDHCEHFSQYGTKNIYYCKQCGEMRDYWNRCKQFEWKKDALYKENQND